MHDDILKRLRDFAVELRKAEDALLVCDAADAIEALSVVVRAQRAVIDKLACTIPAEEGEVWTFFESLQEFLHN